MLAGIFGGLLVGIVTALLLLFFIFYRMRRRKYDENRYIINGTMKSSNLHYGNTNRNFRNQHVTLLSSSSLSPANNLSAGSSSSSQTTGLLNGSTTTSTRLLKYTNATSSIRKTNSNLSSDSGSPNHDGSFNYAYIKAPTKEFYA